LRFAVLSDIHGNYEALEAVLQHIDSDDVDRILCLGDIVGYGADPARCIDTVVEREALTVAGNHDWGVVERMSVAYFNADARDSVVWTMKHVGNEHIRYLDELPLETKLEDITVVHSTPWGPEHFGYIQTIMDVQLAFESQQTSLCFIGHSHVPVVFYDTNPVEYLLEDVMAPPPGVGVLFNVGSVGQPRDGEPEACYAIYDSDKHRLEMRRVEYDIKGAANRILESGLPVTNAYRLYVGQ